MAGTSQATTITHSQSYAEVAIVAKYHHECEILENCTLKLLRLKYEGWESNPSIIPLDSIFISGLHLLNLKLPFSSFFHYIFAIHDIHPLQISTNSIRMMIGFVLLNLIRDLGLGVEYFQLCFVRVRSDKTHKYYFTP